MVDSSRQAGAVTSEIMSVSFSEEAVRAAAKFLWDSGRLSHDRGPMKDWCMGLAKNVLSIAIKAQEEMSKNQKTCP